MYVEAPKTLSAAIPAAAAPSFITMIGDDGVLCMVQPGGGGGKL